MSALRAALANRDYLDRNHGSILIVWDRLFGTFQREDEPGSAAEADAAVASGAPLGVLHGVPMTVNVSGVRTVNVTASYTPVPAPVTYGRTVQAVYALRLVKDL